MPGPAAAGPGDIPPPPRARPRYTSTPFPAYRYAPGLRPHPTRNPGGHSYQPQPQPNRHPPWRPEDWESLHSWLYGVDLFNAFYFWEAHEAWEGLWVAVARDSASGLLLQGLIQIAAALLKAHGRVEAGVHILSAQGLDKLRRAGASGNEHMGLDIAKTVSAFEAYFASAALPEVAEAPALRLTWGVAPGC